MSGEFYKNDYGSRRGEKPHRSLLMWLLDLVMTLLIVVVGAAMAVTYFVPYVNPAGVWFFPLLGLAAAPRRDDAGAGRHRPLQGFALL